MIPKNRKTGFDKRQFRKAKKIIKNLIIIFFISSVSITIIYKRLNPPISNFMSYRILEKGLGFKSIKIQKDRININKVPANMIYGVLGGEDQKFLEHFGFDIEAIENAYEYNLQMNKTILGGSTITQQTAKNLFLWPSRSYIRKGLETYFTLLLELLRSKQRILEVYLNIIEFGDGIYGIQAASMHYFQKPIEKLSKSQIAFLIAILPNPRYYEKNKNSSYLKNRINIIINSLQKMKRDKNNKDFVKSVVD